MPKPPKVPKLPALRIVYRTHASARVRGRGQRVVERKRKGEGARKEEVVVREEEVGVKEAGEGVREAEAEELAKQLIEPIVALTPSAKPISSATHITDKGKQVAELQGKKKGSKRKAPTSSE
ncbi:hypothetical protein Tco_1246237 [Tanacetum coccineum]